MANPKIMHITGKRIYPASLPFKHRDYLSDEYSCDDTEIESFEKYMSRVGEPIVDVFIVRSIYKYKGDKLEHTYVPETHRAHIRSILRFVRDLHNDGRSLESCLEESNIVFHHNQLKLRGLNFVEGASAEDRARDFTLVRNLLESLLDKYNYNNYERPTSLDDLLSALEKYSDIPKIHVGHSFFEYKQLISHLALFTHEASVDYIKNLHDKARYYIHDSNDKAGYDTAVREMQRREFYKGDWTGWFDGAYPQAGPAQDCFQFQYESPPNKRGYVGVGEDGVVNANILRFCRNMATHLDQHIPKHNNGSEFSKKDVDLIIMAMFEDELLSFQRLTFQHRIFQHFIPTAAGERYAPQSTRCGSPEQHYASGSADRGGGGGEGSDEGWETQGRRRKQNKGR